jgi:Spy/CpxP family protein refolding chaperone
MTPRQENEMTRTARIVAIAGVAMAILGSTVALARFGWHGGHGEKFMRRMVDAHVGKTLDGISATPDQRQKVSAIEDKLFADFQVSRDARRGFLKSLTDQFSQPQLDSGALDQAFQPVAQSHEQLRAEVLQAVSEVHDMLTPDQRTKLVGQLKELQARWER